MKTPKNVPKDFSDINGLVLTPSDEEIPRSLLHGTPAVVLRKLDGQLYNVFGLYYDGDAKGFVVHVHTKEGPIELFPGQYQTHALFLWDESAETLNVFILD